MTLPTIGTAILGLLAAAGEPAQSQAPRRLPEVPPVVVSVEGLRPERVRLSVSVLDPDGRPVTGLTASDFAIREGNAPRALLEFSREGDRQDRPLSAVMLVDLSTSVQREVDRWREASAALLSALRPIDELRVATFTDEVRIAQDFTSDPGKLGASLAAISPTGGGTRVLRSVEETLEDLRERGGRKVIFLLTDGLEPDIGQDQVESLVRQAVRDRVTVVTILTGPSGFPTLPAQTLANETGGGWTYPGADLPGLVRRLGQRLLESYHLVYESERDPTDQRRRPVTVTVRGGAEPRWEVRTVSAVFGETPLLDLLARDLEDDAEERRVRAAGDLGGLEEKGAVDLLGRAAKDDSPRVRAAAAASLGRRSEPAAIRWLARLVRDDEPSVREAAVAALVRLQASTDDPAVQSRILDHLERATREPE